jgi:hypothetical protein
MLIMTCQEKATQREKTGACAKADPAPTSWEELEQGIELLLLQCSRIQKRRSEANRISL